MYSLLGELFPQARLKTNKQWLKQLNRTILSWGFFLGFFAYDLFWSVLTCTHDYFLILKVTTSAVWFSQSVCLLVQLSFLLPLSVPRVTRPFLCSAILKHHPTLFIQLELALMLSFNFAPKEQLQGNSRDTTWWYVWHRDRLITLFWN